MASLAKTFTQNIKTYYRINQLKIDRTLKKSILASWFKQFVLHAYYRRTNTATIGPYQIKFIDYLSFTYLFNEIFVSSEYLFSTDKQRPFIIDCGSNIGLSILYFKMLYPNARILAFEPGQDAYACLKQNIKNNKLSSIRAYNLALSKLHGQIDFFFDGDNPGSLMMSTNPKRIPKQKTKVHAAPLSMFINSEVDFMKIDVEGAELDILEDLLLNNKLRYIKQLSMEYHHHVDRYLDSLSQPLKLLEDNGFGYQIGGQLNRPFTPADFQDITIYAYRKTNS